MSSSRVDRTPRVLSIKIFQILFLTSIISAPLYFGAVNLWSFSVSAILLGLSFPFYGFYSLRNPAQSAGRTGLEIWVVVYLAFYAASSVFSRIPSGSFVESYKLAVYLLVFYGSLLFCSDRDRARMLCGVIIFLGSLLSFVGLLQYLGGLPRQWWHVHGFLSSVYVNHNHFAGLLEILLPISIGFTLAERDTARKILFIFMCILMGTAFIFTLSRGGYLSISVAIAVMLLLLLRVEFLRGSWAMTAAIILFIFSAALLFGLAPVGERIQTIFKIAGGDITSNDRFFMGKGAWAVITHHPWFGTGPGTFEFSFLKYRPEGYSGRPVFTHNDYLNLAADCGIPAFLAFVLLYAALFRTGLRSMNRDDSRFRAGVAAGCVAAVISLGVHSLLDFNFHIPANALWFSVAAGLLVSLDRDGSSKARERLNAGAIIPVILLPAVFWGAWFFGLSDFYLWKVKTSTGKSALLQRRFLDKAIVINPFNHEAYYLRGLSKAIGIKDKQETLSALGDFESAIRLNPLEPYYDYHRVKNLILLKKLSAAEAVSSYDAVVEKDPLDPKLCYLAASDLLRAYPEQDGISETRARVLLERSTRLEPSYSGLSYQALWEHEGHPDNVEAFKSRVSGDSEGIFWFLIKKDRWKDYRDYFLQKEGIDPLKKYETIQSVSWESSPAYTFQIDDFTSVSSGVFSKGSCIYGNGKLSKNINLEHGLSRLIFIAKGTRAGRSYPFVVVRLDGRVVDGLYVDSPYYASFYSTLEATPGMHRLELEYVNDFMGGTPKADRNLWIEKIEVQYPKN